MLRTCHDIHCYKTCIDRALTVSPELTKKLLKAGGRADCVIEKYVDDSSLAKLRLLLGA